MTRTTWLAAIIAIGLLGLPASAQQGGADKPGEAAAKPAGKAPPAAKAGETIDMTEEVIFERRTGLYFEGRGGVFFTLGGARGYSNGQPFFGFEIGYDFTDWFSLQVSYASGYQAANPVEACADTGCPDGVHMDFGITFFDVSADFDFVSGRRWAFEGRVGGGVALIDPSAKADQPPVDGDVFAGLRFEYYTLLKHFNVGAEVDYYLTVPTTINSLAISLSIIYTF